MIQIESIVYDPDLGCIVLMTDTETGRTATGVDPALPNTDTPSTTPGS